MADRDLYRGDIDLLYCPDGTVRWFKYVRHEDRARFEAEGWTFAADLGPTHGRWSILMQAPEGFDG